LIIISLLLLECLLIVRNVLSFCCCLNHLDKKISLW